MSDQPLNIPKQPALKPAEDYYRLRREGIGFIEQMGSRQWTDYNLHDPGITILEALCFAITDLAYRTGWDIQDLLMPSKAPPDPEEPYPNQPFFPARKILTNNPLTPDDFRRLLIDLNGVRNAWVYCKQCACDQSYYAWCEEDQLKISTSRPSNLLLHSHEIKPLGLYEVLLELEADPVFGDMNDRKIEETYFVFDDGKPHPVVLECRFPDWKLEQDEAWKLFVHSDRITLTILKFNRTDDRAITVDMTDAELRRNWQTVFYAGFEIKLPAGDTIAIDNVAIRIIGNTTAKNLTTVNELKLKLGNQSEGGIIKRYRSKLLKIKEVITDAKEILHSHRNLDEDYCRISNIKTEDVAVCADVEVSPGADIEKVQAQIWFEIVQYFNPPIPFYSLQDLTGKYIEPAKASGEAVNESASPNNTIKIEEIFNGPALNHGFLKAAELEAANLKTVLHTSDIINRLMDIEGVRAVNNLLLSKYDEQGKLVTGAADPTFSNANPQTPVFDPNKSGAAWLLYLKPLHQPRLYFNLSRFLFYKNGLPFLPRMDEALDTYKLITGETERPKIKDASKDLPIPAGSYRNTEDYFPVQYSLPRTYGVGTDGLPSHASPLRRAQAKQLKAYLMIFEQILGNAHAQLAHIGDLFSLDPKIRQSYSTRLFSNNEIDGYDDLMEKDIDENGLETDSLTAAILQNMIETETEFEERRNRFLDHLLARFGEQFNEYALLLTNFRGEQVGRIRLIDDKLSFLKAYPIISHDRGKAFDYYHNPSAPGNTAGLKKRTGLLLGYPDLSFSFTANGGSPGSFVVNYQIKDNFGSTWFEGQVTTDSNQDAAGIAIYRQLLKQMIRTENYEIKIEGNQFRLQLMDKDGNEVGFALKPSLNDAKSLQTELTGWSSNERSIVIEHLLLRPKFPGDALFGFCELEDCTCEDDPYSFRITVVMPGWTEPFNVNLEMRQFANRTIQQETPSHLLVKTCWVGNDGFLRNPCDQLVTGIASVLEKKGLTATGERPTSEEACSCALLIYNAFGDAFEAWYKTKAKDFFQHDGLKNELKTLFETAVDPSQLTCTTVLYAALWADIIKMMETHFYEIALYGYQFERFEDAWYTWLYANKNFDWTEERLQERVEAALLNNVQGSLSETQKNTLCNCATSILLAYGTSFYNWMDGNLRQGRAFERFTPFVPDSVQLCTGYTFKAGTQASIENLLLTHYSRYKEVSYRLSVVVHLLSKLRNTYPGATLHDCDDGSDQNPVRLNNTALGNYPLRRSQPQFTENPVENDRSPKPDVPPVSSEERSAPLQDAAPENSDKKTESGKGKPKPPRKPK